MENVGGTGIDTNGGCCDTKTPNPECLAAEMYTTYCKAVGGTAYNGDPLPTWEEFKADTAKTKQSDGWIIVAACAINACCK